MPRPILKIRALAGLLLLITSATQAGEWRSQGEALGAGQAAIEQAQRRQFDSAFAQASALARPGDAATQERLKAQKQVAIDSATRLGAVASLSSPDETTFAGCVTRTWRVRYAGGEQRWLLKFRRGTQGWYLSDLDVRPTAS